MNVKETHKSPFAKGDFFMSKIETTLYFVLPQDNSKAQIEIKAARLVNTVPASSLTEAIRDKFSHQLPKIASGKRIRMFVEIDPSAMLADYDIRDDSTIILWIERPEELVETI